MFPSAIDPAEAPITVAAPSANPAPQGWRALAVSLGPVFTATALIPGESQQDYLACRDALLDEIAPTTVVELLLAKTAADHTWELQRYGAVRAKLLERTTVECLVGLLVPRHKYGEAHKGAKRLAEAFLAGDAEAQSILALRLQAMGHSPADVGAQAYARAFRQMQEVERLISKAEQRRNHQLRLVEQRRQGRTKARQAPAQEPVRKVVTSRLAEHPEQHSPLAVQPDERRALACADAARPGGRRALACAVPVQSNEAKVQWNEPERTEPASPELCEAPTPAPEAPGSRGAPSSLGEDERLQEAPDPLPEGHDSRWRASGPPCAPGALDGH